MQGDEWTINGKPRAQGKKECQIIIMDPQACDTCPLAPKDSEEPMSPLLRRLVLISNIQEAGAQIPFDYLTLLEWRCLAMLKAKSHAKQMEEMKKR